MEIDKIKSIAANVITPINYERVAVSFGHGILPEFAKTYVDAMNGKLALRGSSLSFDRQEMEKYLNTILSIRINRVNGEGKGAPEARYFKIPALYALTIRHVGIVYDKDLGIELYPVLDGEIEVMSISEAADYSRRLQLVEDLGFELVEGLPNDRTGEADFMYFHMTEDSLVRHNKDTHPGVGILTAFFRMKQLENVLTFSVSYGLISEYQELLKGLIYDEVR